MNKTLKVGCLVACFAIVSCDGVWKWYNESHPNGQNEYYNMVETAGAIESQYMKFGSYAVNTYEELAEGSLGKFEVWYPVDMVNGDDKCPVIISNNGTGWAASKYTEWFRHMASWGFIVVGNEEGTSWDGDSAQASLEWILKQNNSSESVFYNSVDEGNIATIGHSQGGTGVVNAITVQPLAHMYKTSVMLASTFDGYSPLLQWKSDASKISVPTLVLVANDDGLTPQADLQKLYSAIPKDVFKVMGRRINAGHGDMLVYADGYVTAWMMWQLKNDRNASQAFLGQKPELAKNNNFIEVRTPQMTEE